MSRPTPDRLDEDEDDDLLRFLVSRAGDPRVEPRAEYVASLRTMLLDRLGPPRVARPLRGWLFIGLGLAAACLLAVLVRPRSVVENPDKGQPAPQLALRLQPSNAPSLNTAWLEARRGLEVSEMPSFSWPLQESSPLTISTSIPPDLLD